MPGVLLCVISFLLNKSCLCFAGMFGTCCMDILCILYGYFACDSWCIPWQWDFVQEHNPCKNSVTLGNKGDFVHGLVTHMDLPNVVCPTFTCHCYRWVCG